jgi:Cohesin domain
LKVVKVHIQNHWGKYLIFFAITVISLNFRTIAYLITNDPHLLHSVAAESASTSMVLSPAARVFTVGDIVTVSVLLNAPQQAVNAMAGEIVFPTDKLDLVSISTDASINTIWIPTKPYFSTTTSTVVFSGGMPNPGFEGVDGEILTVSFRVKAVGNAQLSLNKVEVLANDGEGTELDVATQPITLQLQKPPTASGASSQ